MFAALGRFVSRRPWYVIGAWVVLAVVVVATAPALQTTTDEAEFLPDHYESIKAAEVQADEFPSSTTPAAILVFQREDGGELTAEDQQEVDRIAEELGPELGKETFVQQVVTTDPDGQPNVSEDGTGPGRHHRPGRGVHGLRHPGDRRRPRPARRPRAAGRGHRPDGAADRVGRRRASTSEDSSAQTLAIVGIATSC